MATAPQPTGPVARHRRVVGVSLAIVLMAGVAWASAPASASVSSPAQSGPSPSGAAPSGAAQPGAAPADSSTTSSPLPSTPPGASTPDEPTTTAPGGEPSLTPGDTTTTTIAVTPSLPPEYEGSPLAGYLVDPGGTDGLDEGAVQRGFDPGSVTIRTDLVEAARAELRRAEQALAAVQQLVATRRGELAAAEAQLGQLDVAVRSSVSRAAEARVRLADHAVRAYVVGDVDQRLAGVKLDDVTDVGVARRYAGALGTTSERLVREYRAQTARLTDEQSRLAGDLATLRAAVAAAEAGEQPAAVAVFDASAQVAAYEAGAHAYVKGFTFPIAGRSDFIDSWGFPRSGGRWHQGADIFAAHGTPLVASEPGVLEKVGTAGLGGLRLWLVGDSGNEYYYAHLAGFAPGAVDGRRVQAGEIVGYVGDTGNARGTPPHLHFEIHPGGLGPVNPYPLLRAAYDARPRVDAPMPAPPPGLVAPAGG